MSFNKKRELSKLIVDCRMINSSGIGRYLQNILPYILQNFKNITLLGNKNELEKYFEYNSKVRICNFSASIYSIQEQLEYPRIISSCDLFFSPHYNIPLLPIKARHRVTTIHDVFHLAFYDTLSLPQKMYSKFVINQAVKRSDKIITVSNFSKKEILKYTSLQEESKIQTIYNGVEEVSNEDSDIIPRMLINRPYFLYVGNIKPHKNLKRAIEAFKMLLSEKENEKRPAFYIVGKKEGFITGDNIVTIVENDPVLKQYVRFTGWINDEELASLYTNAYALVFPSIYEGFGFPPLEAMTYGCPVISSDRACMPEIYENSVLYCDPYDIESICSTMKRMLHDHKKRDELIIKGFSQVKKYTWQKSAEAHVNLFESLLIK